MPATAAMAIRTVMTVTPRPRFISMHTLEEPLETNAPAPAERDPDDAGAALHVAERGLPDAAFHPAVGGVIAVVAHHEEVPRLHHEAARSLEGRVLAHDDRMLVAVEILQVLPRDHLHIRVG